MKRSGWAVLIVVVIIAAGVGIGAYWHANEAPPPGPAPAPPPTQATAPPIAAKPVLPSFDALNVGPDGSAVIAGRAAPGAEVTVLDHGQPVGHATADANGEWVITTDKPLPPGAQELSLSAKSPGANTTENSATALAVIVPPHGEATPPVAVALPQGEGAAHRFGAASRGNHVALDMVEYDASGKTILSGSAAPGASVDVFIGTGKVGTTKSGSDGTWSLAVQSGVPVGRYHLRLVSHGATGATEEATLDLRRAAPGELGAGDYLAVVPGNTLWHLAQRSYGAGQRYVELYRANQRSITDPNLIYPNQMLALPGKS